MKYIDPDGNALFLSINKAKQTMTVNFSVIVNNERRFCTFETAITTHVIADSDLTQPDKTKNVNLNPDKINKNGSNWTQFPNGEWNIISIKDVAAESQEIFGKEQLITDANQDLPIRLKGGEINKDSNGNIITVKDEGYNIHFTKYSNTAGCIGVKDKEIMDSIIDLFNINELYDPGNAKIKVYGVEE